MNYGNNTGLASSDPAPAGCTQDSDYVCVLCVPHVRPYQPSSCQGLTSTRYSSLLFSYPVSHLVPVVKPDPLRIPSRPFNDSKVALLIEDRPIAHLAPLLLHMISVVPPDWRFVFLGSVESVAFLNNSLAVRTQVRSGKLDLGELPRNFSSKGKEPLSQTLTSVEFWRWLGGKDTWDWKDPYVDEEGEEPNGMAPGRRPQVEWVLIFQTDSILCANSKASLNDWLHYDWVGAPW